VAIASILVHECDPEFNRIDRILILTSRDFFVPKTHLQRTSKLSVLLLDKFEDG
jgi:hypothetical protein